MAVVKAEDGQSGVEAAFVFTGALATAGLLWGAIQGRHPQHQAAE
jgi:hypothetical protein